MAYTVGTSSSTTSAPWGRRLLPAVLDDLATSHPERIYAAVPRRNDLSDGFQDITVADVARCANYMSHWIEGKFGRSDNFETLSYIGIPDLRGAITFLAAVKCGYKLLLPSPRNPASTNASLMEQTRSTKLFHTAELRPLATQLKEAKAEIQRVEIPSFDEMLSSSPAPYPFQRKFAEARHDPIVVLHSSGSTGLPKPITMTHGSFAVLDNERNISAPPGRQKQDWSVWDIEGGGKFFTVFPFFHLAGFVGLLINPIFMRAFPVLGPPNMVPDGQLLKKVMQQQKLATLYLPPAIVEQLFYEPGGIEYFKDLKFLVYTGAPFSPDVGDRLAGITRLVSPFGSTEVFPLPGLATSAEDWAWFEFNPSLKFEMQPNDVEPGTFEMVIFADESTEDTQAMNHNLPGVAEWRTKDLFKQHPTKPNLWKYFGRRDDIIVLHNGEKFNPVPMEVFVQNDPLLAGALVIGQGRSKAALLIEPKPDLSDAQRKDLVDLVWPTVEKSNSLVPGQGRITRDQILVATKPTVRTGKGTIVRKLTERAFEADIKSLYSKEAIDISASKLLKPSVKGLYELENVVDFVRAVAAASCPPVSKIDGNADLYSIGLDSLQTLEIVSGLKQNLRTLSVADLNWISPAMIFRNPTLDGISTAVLKYLNEGIAPAAETEVSQVRNFETIVDEYTRSLPSRDKVKTNTDKHSTVALVGSTGYLGTYLLARLLADSNISQIICLNRSANAQRRQEDSLRSYGLNGQSTDKLAFHQIDLAEPQFGLADPDYEVLKSSVDTIVLNAWRLDFGLQLHSFKPFLNATRSAIDLSLTGTLNPRIVFISSLASVMHWPQLHTGSDIPERPVSDPLAALNIGYAWSKLAAERILTTACERSKVPVDIVRVCQIGGSSISEAPWPEQPWLSALIKTSKTLGAIPRQVITVDWMPVDVVADMIGNIVQSPRAAEVQVYNVSHPRPRTWSAIADLAREKYGISNAISLREWTGRLRQHRDPRAKDVEAMPALVLLDHYEALADGIEYSVETTRALGRREKLVVELSDELLGSWLEKWDI